MPGGGPSAASSLYSGIFNVEAEEQASASSASTQGKKDLPLQENNSEVEGETAVKGALNETAASTKPQGSALYGRFPSCHTISLLCSAHGIRWRMT